MVASPVSPIRHMRGYQAWERRARENDRRRRVGATVASALAHGLVIVLLALFLPSAATVEAPPPIPVHLVEGHGAAGATGGSGGGAAELGLDSNGGTTAPKPATAESSTPAEATAPAPAAAPERRTAEPPAPAAPAAPTPDVPPSTATSLTPAASAPETAASPSPAPAAETTPTTAAGPTEPQTARLTEEHQPPPPPRKPRPPVRIREPAATAATPTPPPPATPAIAEPAPAAPPQTATGPVPQPQPGTPGSGEGTGGSVGRGLGSTGLGRGDVGNGDLQSPGDDYLDRVRRRISQFKHYPEAAKQQKQQGGGSVGFKIARDGTVLDAWIEHSTGFPMLDAAILQAVHEASPVPPVPERYRGAQLTVVMPYDFSIGLLDRIFR